MIVLKRFPFDNGKEFSGRKALAAALGCDIYFAHPYHSWERG
jgi:IS30 family transposase